MSANRADDKEVLSFEQRYLLNSANMTSENEDCGFVRSGDPLEIGRQAVTFGRNILAQTPSGFELQPRLFVNDPWELVGDAIQRHYELAQIGMRHNHFGDKLRTIFVPQRTVANWRCNPSFLYYAFLNLSKAYAVAKGNTER